MTTEAPHSVESLVDESYRDGLSTIGKDGKRIWLYPKAPKGKFTNYRETFYYFLIAILLVMPWVKINGYPLFLINVFERKFILFSVPFFPQDFHLFAVGILTFFVFVMLFTAVFGRVWCGWACPQTIFMEGVFRKIEYWIEGTPSEQKRLNEGPLTGEKIWKKALKHGVYILFSLIISHSVMAYLVGTEQMFAILQQGPFAHLPGFIGLMAFTGAFYFVFSKLREQVCTVICPYGRLQGVLLGKESMVVAYDYVRGEDRARKKTEPNHGDCIDCGQCVRVCPTGIDIRNGTQLECINCTACIDACDDIMTKLGRDTGLVRVTSMQNIEKKLPFKITPRIIGYSLVLTVLIAGIVGILVTRSPIDASITRVPGQLYIAQPDGKTISNLYNIKIINKTFEEHQVSFKVKNIEGGEVRIVGDLASIKEGGAGEAVVFVDLPKSSLKPLKNKIKLEVWSDGEMVSTIKTNFMAPTN